MNAAQQPAGGAVDARRSMQYRNGSAPQAGEPSICCACDQAILPGDNWLQIGVTSSNESYSLAIHEHCRALAPSERQRLRQARNLRLARLTQ